MSWPTLLLYKADIKSQLQKLCTMEAWNSTEEFGEAEAVQSVSVALHGAM